MDDNKKHIVAITAFIKNQSGDKFLIVKRGDHEVAYPGKWAYPGGKAEKGDDILTTLKKEVMEEVGLEIEDYKKFLKDFTFVRPDEHNVIGFAFLVKAKSEDVKLDENDFSDYKWVTPEEFYELDYIPTMEEEVELAFRK